MNMATKTHAPPERKKPQDLVSTTLSSPRNSSRNSPSFLPPPAKARSRSPSAISTPAFQEFSARFRTGSGFQPGRAWSREPPAR